MRLNIPFSFHFFPLRKAGTILLDTIFPLFCLGCGVYGSYLCENCLKNFPRRLKQRCPTCFKKTTPHGEVCFDCSYKNALDGLFAGSLFRSPLVSTSVHTFKYNFIPSLAKPLGQWLAERVLEIGLPLPDYFISVPLHSRRLRFRGFNQSELLTTAFIDALTPGFEMIFLKNSLLRKRYTKPQMKTRTKDERLRNLTDAFTVTEESVPLIWGKSIWLIDDVSTTGTTLEECASVLKRAGAKSVFGIVLAR